MNQGGGAAGHAGEEKVIVTSGDRSEREIRRSEREIRRKEAEAAVRLLVLVLLRRLRRLRPRRSRKNKMTVRRLWHFRLGA